MTRSVRSRMIALLWLWMAMLAAFNPAMAAEDHYEDDLQLWAPVTLELPVNKKLSAFLQVEPRLRDNLRDMNLLIVLPTISYKIHPNVALQAGYGWYPSFHPEFRNEHRMLQQVFMQKSFKRLKVSLRSRIEERFIEDADGASIRNRYLLRLETPIKQGPYYLVAYDEVHINLNSVDNGPKSGFDQNRLFGGVGRYFGKERQGSAEVGYHLQTLNLKTGAPDQMNHAIMVRLNYRLPEL